MGKTLVENAFSSYEEAAEAGVVPAMVDVYDLYNLLWSYPHANSRRYRNPKSAIAACGRYGTPEAVAYVETQYSRKKGFKYILMVW